jgi:hypothetical protein
MICFKTIFWPILKIFSFRVVLGLCGTIVAPPIMVQSKQFLIKSYYLCITYTEIVQNSKSSQKNSHSCVPLKVPSVRIFFKANIL